jgi:hypothetical protein
MNGGLGATYSTYSMGSSSTRADAIADLESMGYPCSSDEADGQLLMDVGHSLNDTARVRCAVLRADRGATVLRR